MKQPSVLSLFSGAGGLDLGFEAAGFTHLEAVELNSWCIDTLRKNRPQWNPRELDARTYEPDRGLSPDVLIAGPPCQGFSLGGNRRPSDARNDLFREVIRVTATVRPKVVVIENVLNLRTMSDPVSRRPFAAAIAHELEALGYDVQHDFFRMSHFGVPQTRRRFVFVALRDDVSAKYEFPAASKQEEPAIGWLGDVTSSTHKLDLPNHNPSWDFVSRVHRQTGAGSVKDATLTPFRISRTASDGHPVRSLDRPFPAVDTATVWGWAAGNVVAQRVTKDRRVERFVRNPTATTTLWRVTADHMRSFTHREYARLQTFPDNWEFVGGNKRDIHKQIGNAVPVAFAEQLGKSVMNVLRG